MLKESLQLCLPQKGTQLPFQRYVVMSLFSQCSLTNDRTPATSSSEGCKIEGACQHKSAKEKTVAHQLKPTCAHLVISTGNAIIVCVAERACQGFVALTGLQVPGSRLSVR